MVWLIIIGVVLALLAIALALVAIGVATEGGWALAFSAFILVVVVVCAFGSFRSFVAASRAINRESCESYADQTGYTTKLIITTAFDGGTCMVRFDDKWVPRDQLWAEMRQP